MKPVKGARVLYNDSRRKSGMGLNVTWGYCLYFPGGVEALVRGEYKDIQEIWGPLVIDSEPVELAAFDMHEGDCADCPHDSSRDEIE